MYLFADFEFEKFKSKNEKAKRVAFKCSDFTAFFLISAFANGSFYPHIVRIGIAGLGCGSIIWR